MATTRHGLEGIGVRPYSGFTPKDPATPSKGEGQFTRLITIGIGGRRRLFAPKGEGTFTRLLSYGIGGKRVAFIAKPQPDKEENGGHAYYFQEEKNRRREEEEDRLKSLKELQTEFEKETELAETTYQKEVELITKNVEEIETTIGKTIESKIEGIIEKPDDIGLILAIIEATS